jgi:hypothetical protein
LCILVNNKAGITATKALQPPTVLTVLKSKIQFQPFSPIFHLYLMKDTLTLTINQPCDQSWEEMQPAISGKFCGACEKIVIDFTAFSDKQFISYFQNYPDTLNLCAKFSMKQLSLKIPPKPAPVAFWNPNKFSATSLIAALDFIYKAEAN